ncbi:hypothetical protein [Halomonas sp. 3F2F]|nr:hypothetical protein [Halomonas sp. 3F2F]
MASRHSNAHGGFPHGQERRYRLGHIQAASGKRQAASGKRHT